MTWPIRSLTILIWLSLGAFLQVQAQALPITPPPVTSSSTDNSGTTPTVTSGGSLLDFSLLNWRMGLLSPYAQTPVTSSSTSSSQPTAPTAPSNNNPYVGTTIGMQGGMTSTTSNSAGQTNPVFSTSSPTPTTAGMSLGSVYFAPRFVSFADLTPNYGLNSSLLGNANPAVHNVVPLSGFDPTINVASVPEPGRIFLCGGLLALVGYGWSRRRKAMPLKSDEAKAILMGETNEAMST